MPQRRYISKSSYMAGLDCHRKLWQKLWDWRSAAPLDGMTELVFEFGRRFGVLAHSLYPGAHLIDVNVHRLNQAAEDTREAIQDGADVILEAAFCYGQCRVLSDIVIRQEDGTWHLIEVKSSTEVKDEHYQDLAYQKWVMEQSGYPVSKCSVMHSDTENGVWPDLHSLFMEVGVTEEVNIAYQGVADNVAAMLPLAQPGSVAPEARPLFSKACNDCEFKKTVCWVGIEEPTIYEVIHSQHIAALEALDVFYVKDIPDDFRLRKDNRPHVDCMNAKAINIDTDGIRSMLDELEYPIYFLDFETIAVAAPLYAGNHPWEKLPFQYSVHVLKKDGELTHAEYLHEEDTDPSEALADHLVEDIGSTGSVVVYHKTMEDGRLEYLAGRFPHHAEALNAMRERIWDLEIVFKKHYRHWKFGSKSSIKVVLPVLVPDETYEDEAISDGGEASWSYIQILESDDMFERQQKLDALRSYCKKDTIAMVRLLEHVRTVV